MVRRWNTFWTSRATTTCTVKPCEKRTCRTGIGYQCLLLRRDVVAVSLPARPRHSPAVGHRARRPGGPVFYLRCQSQNLASLYCISWPVGALGCRRNDQCGIQLGGDDRRRGAGRHLVLPDARVGGFAGRVFERMGGVPQNIPGGEIYTALEKGTIDAAEWVGPYDDQKLGLNKVAPFYYYPGWWEGGPQLDLFVNDKAFASLSPENKAIIECAAAFAHTEMQAKYDAKNPDALKQLVGAKTKVLPFPKDVLDLAFKESMKLYKEISEKNENWKKVYSDYSAFRKDQNLWFRFTEARFDSFMQSQKL